MKEIELRIVETERPNGQTYGVFFLGIHEIGRADKMLDGWKPFGKRNVLPEVHATKAMIDSLISRADKARVHALSLLNDLRLHNGGSLPPKLT